MKNIRVLKIILVSVGVMTSLIIFQNCSNSMAPMDLDAQASMGGNSTESLAIGVINNKCYQCHMPGVNMGGIDYINDVPSLKYYRVAIPGQAAASPLYTVLSDRDDHSALLSAPEIQLIYNWVQTGMEAQTPGSAPAIIPLQGTYSSIYRNIIVQKCSTCHANPLRTPPRGGQLNYSSYSSLMASGVVNANNAAGSLIYQAVSRMPGDNFFMPQGGQRLTDAERQAIMDWINAGALDN